MSNLNNLNIFLNDPNKNTLIVCDLGESVSEFYISWIKELSKNKGYSIHKMLDKDDFNAESDLFGDIKIHINFSNKLNDIQKRQETTNKVIFFTNYKNFKILKNKFLFISPYDLQKDIQELLKDFQQLDQYYLKYLFNNPHMFFMELSKINTTNKIEKNMPLKEFETNEIVENRRKIFASKGDLLKIYNLIKKETLIKKFNFLIY